MNEINMADILIVSPFLALFLASLIPITVKVLRGNVEQPPLATLTQGLGGFLGACILLLTVFVLVGKKDSPTAFAGALVLDGLTVSVGILALLVGAGALLLMHDNPATRGNQFSELVFLTMNSVLGMLVLVSAVDLLIIYIGLEVMSLCLYMMIAISNEQKLSKEAAIKYFILGGLASAIFLYGVSFLFGTMGSSSLQALVELTPELIVSSRLFLFGMILLIVGFAFKVSLAPFHAWTPDVYEGSPTPLTALMATASKAVAFAAILRVVAANSLVESENLLEVVQWLAVITMLVGNLAALVQRNMKRMLAYSSIAHSGYLMVGIVAAGVSDQMAYGASGVIYYLVGYSVMTLGALAIVALFERTENTVVTIDSLAGLAKRNPGSALCFTIFLLSLAGIPPTVGFFGKFYIFSAAIGEGLIWLALWGVINSVIGVYYYLRPIVYMYMKEEEPGTEYFQLPGFTATRVAIAVCLVSVLILGIIAGPVFKIIEGSIL